MNIPDVVGHKFIGLAHEWKRTRPHSSRVKDLIAVPAYQEIVKMGWPVVPCIIREFIEGRVDHWFSALCQITGQDPVDPSHRGALKAMAEDWISWWDSKRAGVASNISKERK